MIQRILICILVAFSMNALDATWSSPPDLLSAIGQNVSDVHVAVDPNGNAVAIWRRTNGTNFIVQSSSKPFGGSWSSPVDLSATGQDATNPEIGIDGFGNATAIWRRSNGTNQIIQTKSKPFIGNWDAVATDLSATGQDANNPQIAVSENGNAVAIWDRSNGLNTIIQAKRKPFGGDWDAVAVDLSLTGQDATSAKIGTDANGNAVAIWLFGSPSIVQTSSLSFATNTWVPMPPVTQNISSFVSPTELEIAVNATGKAVAVWTRNAIAIQAAIREGGVWLPAQDISTTTTASGPQVAIDSSGNATAVWNISGVNSYVQYVTLTGTTWTSSTDISPFLSDSADVAMSSGGDTIILWIHNDGSNDLVQAVTKSSGGSFSSPVTLSLTGQDASEPEIGMSASGAGVAVWDDNTVNGVYSATWTPPPVPTVIHRPRDFEGKLFKVHNARGNKHYYLKSKWKRPSSNNAVSYRIYNHGKFEKATPSLHFNEFTHSTHLHKRYTVTAVAADGTESSSTMLVIKKVKK